MNKKAKRAISALNSHLESIESISSVQEGNNWKASLKDTINLYIGENSSISQRLDKLYFTKKEYSTVSGVIGVFTDHVYDNSLKQNFKNLIAAAIKHIESNGIYKSPNKGNLLSSFSNAEIISGIVVAVGIIFGIGNYFGRHEKDKESIRTEETIKEIEKENNHLKQSNDSLKQIIEKQNSISELTKIDSIK